MTLDQALIELRKGLRIKHDDYIGLFNNGIKLQIPDRFLESDKWELVESEK